MDEDYIEYKYSIGDKVQIISKISEKDMDAYASPAMRKFQGHIVTIRAKTIWYDGENSLPCYYIEEDKDDTNINTQPGWMWVEKFLEDITPDIDQDCFNALF